MSRFIPPKTINGYPLPDAARRRWFWRAVDVWMQDVMLWIGQRLSK